MAFQIIGRVSQIREQEFTNQDGTKRKTLSAHVQDLGMDVTVYLDRPGNINEGAWVAGEVRISTYKDKSGNAVLSVRCEELKRVAPPAWLAQSMGSAAPAAAGR